MPVLHRNLGLALIADGQLERAREVLTEGVDADPSNVEVYLALDQVLSLLGRPAPERVAALERHPDPRAMPSALVFKLALALIEAERFDDAERLFPGRFFPREEFGTNPRQVYLEARLQRALALARAGRREEALADRVPSRGRRARAALHGERDGRVRGRSPRVQYLMGELLRARRRRNRGAAELAGRGRRPRQLSAGGRGVRVPCATPAGPGDGGGATRDACEPPSRPGTTGSPPARTSRARTPPARGTS